MTEKLPRFIMIQCLDDLIVVLRDAQINWDFGTITGVNDAVNGKSTLVLSSVLMFSEVSEEVYESIVRQAKKSMAALVERK